MNVNAHLGPTTLYGTHGKRRFRPEGHLHEIGLQENPVVKRTGAKLLAGRFFVGFNVGGSPRWTVDDVIDVFSDLRTGGASFIVQRGIYAPEKGQKIEEQSAQILVFNDEGLSRKAFTDTMISLAEELVVRLEQDEIYLDIQNRGVTVDSYSVTQK